VSGHFGLRVVLGRVGSGIESSSVGSFRVSGSYQVGSFQVSGHIKSGRVRY
jgi:hypothetical protein